MKLGLLNRIGGRRKRHKRAGKTKAARERQLANLRLRHQKIKPQDVEISRSSRTPPDKIPPIEKANILEFCKFYLGISFDERPAQATILKSLYGLPLNADDLKIYQKLTGNFYEFEAGQVKTEAVFVLGARAGKSMLASIICLFEATRGKWKQHLSEGEIPYIVVVGTRQAQSEAVIQANVARLVQRSKALSKLAGEIYQSEMMINGVKIISLPSNSTAGRGLPVICLILDEMAFMQLQGIREDEKIFNSLRRGQAQFPGAKTVCISTAAAKQGLFWRMFKEGACTPSRLTVQAKTRQINPIIPQTFIDSEYKRDPVNANREYGAQFSEKMAAFLTLELINACLVLQGDHPYRSGYQYSLGIDASGLSGADLFAAVVCHREGGQFKVDVTRSWETKNPDTIMAGIKALATHYYINSATIDQYAKGWVSAALRGIGLSVNVRPKLAEIFQNLKTLMIGGRVLMPDNPDLKAAFENTQAYYGKSNQLTIAHERSASGHADLADATATAIFSLSKTAYSSEGIKVRVGHSEPDSYGLGGPRKSLLDRAESGDQGWDVLKRPPRKNLLDIDKTYKIKKQPELGRARPDPKLEGED